MSNLGGLYIFCAKYQIELESRQKSCPNFLLSFRKFARVKWISTQLRGTGGFSTQLRGADGFSTQLRGTAAPRLLRLCLCYAYTYNSMYSPDNDATVKTGRELKYRIDCRSSFFLFIFIILCYIFLHHCRLHFKSMISNVLYIQGIWFAYWISALYTA